MFLMKDYQKKRIFASSYTSALMDINKTRHNKE